MSEKKNGYEIPAQFGISAITNQRNEAQDRLANALALINFLEDKLAETEQKLITATIRSKDTGKADGDI